MLVAGRYTLVEPIGAGGMGEVWRGIDEVLGREVAVKLLRPGRDDVDTEGLTSAERFRLEARAAAKVNDPHVVTVYDFGVYDGQLFLVMELVDGRSLSVELATVGVMEPALAASIIAQAAAGLQAAHNHGVIHRDLKPANLLVAMDGTVKVADFGIARLVTDPGTTQAAPGEVAGTPNYLAPERAMGRPGGAYTDVYALGCVGYHLVTGRPPFKGEVPAAIAYQHVDAAPVPPRELEPAASGELEELLLWMMAKDPDDRPTMGHVAETMDAISQRYTAAAADTDQIAVARDQQRIAVHTDVKARSVVLVLAAVACVVAVLLAVRFAAAEEVAPPTNQDAALAPSAAPSPSKSAESAKPVQPSPHSTPKATTAVTHDKPLALPVRTTSVEAVRETSTPAPSCAHDGGDSGVGRNDKGKAETRKKAKTDDSQRGKSRGCSPEQRHGDSETEEDH